MRSGFRSARQSSSCFCVATFVVLRQHPNFYYKRLLAWKHPRDSSTKLTTWQPVLRYPTYLVSKAYQMHSPIWRRFTRPYCSGKANKAWLMKTGPSLRVHCSFVVLKNLEKASLPYLIVQSRSLVIAFAGPKTQSSSCVFTPAQLPVGHCIRTGVFFYTAANVSKPFTNDF